MTLTSFIKRDRYFVLKKNFSVEEFFTIDDALEVGDKLFIIIDRFKEFFQPLGGYDWRLSEFTFLNENRQPFNLTDNSWSIRAIDITYKTSNQLTFDITVSDPSKKIRRISCQVNESRNYKDHNSHDIKIVQTTLEKLYEYSKFANWEQIDMQNENIRLKNKIELLTKEIDVLKKQNTKK